jgi:hypothetical protein
MSRHNNAWISIQLGKVSLRKAFSQPAARQTDNFGSFVGKNVAIRLLAVPSTH